VGYIAPEYALIMTFLGGVELLGYCENIQGEGRPGNYGADLLDRGSAVIVPGPIADEETHREKLSAEIDCARLVMMAIICVFFQDGLLHSA